MQLSKNKFFGALTLESMLPTKYRRAIENILNISILFCLLFLLIFFLIRLSSYITIPGGYKGPSLAAVHLFLRGDFWLGILYLLFALRIPLLALSAFFNSKTYDKKGDIGSDFYRRLNFYAASVWYEIDKSRGISVKDLLYTLPKTRVGSGVLMHLGISREAYQKFLDETEGSKNLNEDLNEIINYLEKNVEGEITFKNVLTAVFQTNKVAHEKFITGELTIETIKETAQWVEEEETSSDLTRRWWTRERLGRIPGFAKDWAYGHITYLEKFARDFTDEAREKEGELIGRGREVKLVEAALLKRRGANAIIIGEPGTGKHVLLLGLVKMIAEGKIFPELEHKRVLELHGASVTSTGKTKGEIEAILIQIFNEAVKAGNIILAIDEFPEFVESLSTLGINATEIFSPYLSNDAINILALGDTLSYRRILENNAGLMKFFEKVDIGEPGQDELIKILQELAPAMEKTYGNKIVITYPALEKISTGSIQYLVQGALPKRAVDLMEEALKEAAEQGSQFLTQTIVQNVLERKTKLPLGEIKIGEQEKLLKLEELLHHRVVGQNEAITAISNAIRRARAGIKNPARPIGTFLFLGPTGVGKTETAKALAEIYFGNEDAMVRFDMTEYQNEEDIEKLIGSQRRNEPGILTSKIRSSPYSVILLDEFEKSHDKVRNLFLQILDEGFFSDFLGQKINMRNTIIIATSNAGAQLIWEMIEKNIDPSAMEHEIVEHIQKEKVMSPELLNRFDTVVVFQPLSDAARLEIARLMLARLASRLKKQNMTLEITDDLCRAVVKGGYDPTFGARPMQRFIQDKIEKIISEKIIRGEVKSGGEFSLSSEELK